MYVFCNVPQFTTPFLVEYMTSLLNVYMQEHSFEHDAFGQWLGWLMAAIYMGGRIPQIVLNVSVSL